jgi:Glycosyltransferase family 87
MRPAATIAKPKGAATLPPLWLAASALAAAIVVAFGVVRWVDHFISDPNAEDFRLHLVAARIGLSHGWSHIYDFNLQKEASVGLSGEGSLIDSMHVFISPPPSAWVVAPLASLPISTGYLIWTLISLAAFIGAGLLVCPGPRLARLTLLLVSLALWPVHYQFWLGQWVVATLALLALAWWLLELDRWALAGIVLALAFCAKPQDVLLLPMALLVSGRWKPVAVFAVTGAFLATVSAASLGSAGIASWLNDVALVRADPNTAPVTYSFIFGRSSLATGVEVAAGLAALGLAWYRRDRLDLVFALGIVGTTASTGYLHEDDIAILVLAAWIVLRVRPSLLQQAWLLAGIAAAQFIAIGLPIPMLLWEPVWIALLGLEPRLKRLDARRAAHDMASSPSANAAVP